MNKKCVAVSALIMLAIGGGMFYGGMRYQKSKAPVFSRNAGERGNFQPGDRQRGGNRLGSNTAGGDFVAGEIISKDDNSVTVKIRDGGSKIIFFSDSTSVGKSVEGSAADLSTSQQVMVSGKQNSDGTLTAQSIQIRPSEL